MKMTILTRSDDITHVALDGHLDTTGVEEIESLFLDATAGRERPTIVELAQVAFMASRGIGLLLAASKRLKKKDCRLVLLQPQELVDSSLRMTRIDTVMPIAYDLDEAVRIALGGGKSAPARSSGAVAREPLPPSPLPTGEADAHRAIPGEIKLSLKNNVSELKPAAAAAAEFLSAHGIDGRAAYAVRLAIDELVTNVIRYAYVDDDEHSIDLTLTILEDRVDLQIVDDGRPFDPRTGPALDLHAEEREVGGLGLMMVLDMVERLRYERRGENNWVEVRIRQSDDDHAMSPSVAENEGE